MSRCYPFPPPGYVRNGIRDGALIESIKRQEEKAKKDRKREKKREKREKKRKESESGKEGSKKHSHKRRRKDEDTKEIQKVINACKAIDNETELFEKSCLTDERENQTASQNSCDSTINSNERPKQSPPLDGKHNASESIIRIRLPVKRQKDPEVRIDKDEQPYSLWGRNQASQPAPRELVDQPCSISASVAQQHALSPSKENRRSSFSGSPSHIKQRLSQEKISSCSHPEQPMAGLSEDKPCSTTEGMVQPSSLCTICPPEVAVEYLNLIDNWVPDPVARELADSGEQEWWCQKLNKHNIGMERCQASTLNTSQGSSNSTLWPSACFLPEADIYALPYAVPF